MLHQSATPQSLSAVRIWVFGILHIKILLDPVTQLARLPSTMMELPGLFHWMTNVLTPVTVNPAFLITLKAGLLLTSLLALLGIKFRLNAIAAACFFFIQQTIFRSFGFMNHAELGLLLVVTFLGTQPCNASYVLASLKPSTNCSNSQAVFAMTMLAVILLTFYSFVGIHRLCTGNFEIFTSDQMKYWLLHRSFNPLDGHSSLGRWLIGQPLLYTGFLVGFFVTTVIEASSVICLFSRRFRYLWLTTMLSFHLLSPLVMCINFWETTLLLAVLFDRHDIPSMILRKLPADLGTAERSESHHTRQEPGILGESVRLDHAEARS